jgi:hypothetical protein
MGKAARIRRKRHHDLPSGYTGTVAAGPVRGGTPQAVELVQSAFLDTTMPCRATFLDDPLFGKTAALAASQAPGRIPVLLFEPPRALIMQRRDTSSGYMVQSELMVASGFHRVPPRFVINGDPAPGWALNKVPGGVVLRDADGSVRAEGRLDLEPQWVSAAVSFTAVLVLYGPKLGVRPPGRPADYTAQARAEEFTHGRREGSLLAATVPWRGTLTETLNWTMLRAGSLGLPLPLAYVPAWHFRAFGGPEAFGFRPMASPETGPVVFPIAHGLAGRLTPTDYDLIRPGADAQTGFVTGYYAPPGDRQFAAWRKEALQHRRVLVAAGLRDMPVGPGADPARQALDALVHSHAAAVPLDPQSLRDAPDRHT